jgi:predicted phosphodiesterase
MRYGIFSDIHSNLEALSAVLDAYSSESIDQYLCVGDVVGYGANPAECINEINKPSIITVAGNHDWAACDLIKLHSFNPEAKDAVLWTKQALDEKDKDFLKGLDIFYKNPDLTLVHGTLDSPRNFDYLTDNYGAWRTFKVLETKVCFVGHTHVAGTFVKFGSSEILYIDDETIQVEEGRRYIVNCGSVGQPRDSDPRASYCIYDTQKNTVQIKRIAYDVEAAGKRIVDAGLPVFLAERLKTGI